MFAKTASVLRVVCLLVLGAYLSIAQTLTVNKYQFAGDAATFNTVTLNKANVAALAGSQITSAAVAAQVLYVVTISNPNVGSPITSSVWEAGLASLGFYTSSVTCWASTVNSTCPSFPTLPQLGPFTISTNDQIVFFILGSFGPIPSSTTGSKDNVVTDVSGNTLANTNLKVPGNQLVTNFGVDKSASVPIPFGGGQKVTYTIRFTNTGPVSAWVPFVQLQDYLQNNFGHTVTYALSGFNCASSIGTDCPDMPAAMSGTLGPYGAMAPFKFPFGIGKGNVAYPGSFTITFDALFTLTDVCYDTSFSLTNWVVIQYSTSTETYSDPIPSDNQSSVTVALDTSKLPHCSPAVVMKKVQRTISAWGNPGVQYDITLTNPGNNPVTVPLTDVLSKTFSTPVFTASLTTLPACVVGCALVLVKNYSPVLVNTNYFNFPLFDANITIPGKTIGTVRFRVKFIPYCETDAGPDQIWNTAESNGGYSNTVFTNMPEQSPCQLSACKHISDKFSVSATGCPSAPKFPPPQIVFGTPIVFQVFYHNQSNTLNVGSIRDALSLSSSTYGDLDVTYQGSCNVQQGTVTPAVPPFSGSPTVRWNNPGWAGVTPIYLTNLTFGPNSTLGCVLVVTPRGLHDPSATCQGSGTPQLENYAFMDLSQYLFVTGGYKPIILDSVAANLPLCREVQVNKSASPTSGGPGRAVTFTITVTNNGKDPVSGFTFSDPVVPPFKNPVILSSSPSSAVCSASATSVDASFPTLNPSQVGTCTFTATAPSAGGSDKNVVTGKFPPGGNWFFNGLPGDLQATANIQVLTPTLTKQFTPPVVSGQTTGLVFTVTNAPGNPSQSGIGFTDTLPLGLIYNTGSVTNSCGGTVAFPSANQMTLTGGTLLAGQATCQISVQVRTGGDFCGTFINSQANITGQTNLDSTQLLASQVVMCVRP